MRKHKAFLRVLSVIISMGILMQIGCNTPKTESEVSESEEIVTGVKDDIILANQDFTAPICIDAASADYDGISLIANAIAGDIEAITDQKPQIISLISASEIPDEGVVIIAGTLDDTLIKEQNLAWDIKPSYNDSSSEEWERFQIQVAESENGSKKIIVAGSDKRGTIYGLFYITQDLGGVSPWIWWGDTKPAHKDVLSFTKEQLTVTSKTPSVKYRGIFLNDEAPSLSSFVSARFGNFNFLFYDNVFELILRLKGNYLWPAMWGNSFSDDGVLNINNAMDFSNRSKLPIEEQNSLANVVLADRYGVVMGLSHHEPMYRAGIEWQNMQRGSEPVYTKPTVDDVPVNTWNYFLNRDNIYDFWTDGFNRNKEFDNLVPIGMRGEGDSELRNPDGTPFTLAQNIDLLKNVITDQKEIMKNAGASGHDQVLVLYKEVEKYWYGDEETVGLNQMEEIKDDIIVLCEDNNNYLRTLPMEDERDRRWGLYYHFDFVGGPRSYMWVNVTPLQRVWDNMTMAYDYQVRDLWIVNVGDLKPMELPMSYFLDMAYDFETYGTANPNSSDEYTQNWVKQQFTGMNLSEEQVRDISQILTDYVDMNGRKRPETIFSNTFSILNYNEAQIELSKAVSLENRADEYLKLFENSDYADAFYQLVYYPAAAVATVNKMWLYQGLNEYYEKDKSTLTNVYAALIEQALKKDEDLMYTYNYVMSGGYWRGMMNQVNHTGYEQWNHESATYPAPLYVAPSDKSEMIVNVQGVYMGVRTGNITMPTFESTEMQQYYVTLSNSGNDTLNYSVTTDSDWIVTETGDGSYENVKILGVYIDWSKVDADKTGVITITCGEQTVNIAVNAKVIGTDGVPNKTYFPSNGVISIIAKNYSDNKAAADGTIWQETENYGKTGSTMKMSPTTVSFENPADGPFLEYNVYIPEDGNYTLTAFVGASNNRYYSEVTMRYGVQIDGTGGIVTPDTLTPDYVSGDSYGWSLSILNNGRIAESRHDLTAGVHTIRIYGVDAGLLLEKLTLSKDPLKTSHFGPQETYYTGKAVTQQPFIPFNFT